MESNSVGEDSEEEKDWAAAKAFFDNLKTSKPRPVSYFLHPLQTTTTFFLTTVNAVLYFYLFYLFYFSTQPKSRFAVTIAVSSRTLFNMVEERKIYEEDGVETYVKHQVEHESEPLKPGAAFPFVKVKLKKEKQMVRSRSRRLPAKYLQGVVPEVDMKHSSFIIHSDKTTAVQTVRLYNYV